MYYTFSNVVKLKLVDIAKKPAVNVNVNFFESAVHFEQIMEPTTNTCSIKYYFHE